MHHKTITGLHHVLPMEQTSEKTSNAWILRISGGGLSCMGPIATQH
jgi:hypothetical protein